MTHTLLLTVLTVSAIAGCFVDTQTVKTVDHLLAIQSTRLKPGENEMKQCLSKVTVTLCLLMRKYWVKACERVYVEF